MQHAELGLEIVGLEQAGDRLAFGDVARVSRAPPWVSSTSK